MEGENKKTSAGIYHSLEVSSGFPRHFFHSIFPRRKELFKKFVGEFRNFAHDNNSTDNVKAKNSVLYAGNGHG
jgi:hypothetical protein